MKFSLLFRGVSISRPFFKHLATARAPSSSSFSTSASSSVTKWDGGVSLVQGASRGIGLEFVKQLLEKNEHGHVIATCRSPKESIGLKELQSKFAERLDILRLDLTIESTIEEVAEAVKDKYGSLNLLINASGILSIPDVLHPVQRQH